jgi:RNA polymerase sigma-70 factor (ECF subfamily)
MWRPDGEVTLNAIFDATWRTQALACEVQAIGRLAEAAVPPLYAFCLYRVGRNRHVCEEVVQETLVDALRKLRQYDPDRSHNDIFPWLMGLARNAIQRAMAKERASVSLEALWSRMDRELLQIYARLDSAPYGEELLQREETRDMVNITMSQLPAHYRQALEAKYVQGRSVQEIATDASTSEKAIESLLTRAREAFRVTFTALATNLGV